MKRFISALALCVSLLLLGSYFITSSSLAKENVLLALLNLPAPPPPNPLVSGLIRQRDPKFYDKAHPPKDDAPIEDLVDYWIHQAQDYRGALFYFPRPSERVIERLFGESRQDPDLVSSLLNVLPENKKSADFVKEMYERAGENRGERARLKQWLTFNSNYFSGDLERVAVKTSDSNEYVDLNTENNVLALTRWDWDRAKPIVDRLYNDNSQPVSKVLAMWALYRHAMETDSISDIDRYRSELMRIVEDRNLSDGVRDKANDALTHEPDFPGRDEWSFSLFEDETLVEMPRFTMLTTLIMYSSPEKYVSKMVELLGKSSNPTVKTAAARNLLVALARDPSPEAKREIIKSLLPWLENSKWLTANEMQRRSLVQELQSIEMRESVPGLIVILNEKIDISKVDLRNSNSSANAMATAANVAPGANRATSISNSNTAAANVGIPNVESVRQQMLQMYGEYPYRNNAIIALGMQKDMRAVPHLRRVLNEVDDYQRLAVVRSLFFCDGFSILEQVEALETVAKSIGDEEETRAVMANAAAAVANAANTVANAASTVEYDYPRYTITSSNIVSNTSPLRPTRPATAEEIRAMLGLQLMQTSEVSDGLVKAVVDRIEVLDAKDPKLARSMRKIMLNWRGNAVNMILLRDLKNGKLESAGIVRLLSYRRELRETMQSEVYEIRTGDPAAVGISACIMGDTADYDTILAGESSEAKTALLACARLIRAPLTIPRVAENLQSKDALLAKAAEFYLESEDSPEARAIVLGLYPNEAKILGATTAFMAENGSGGEQAFIHHLFASVNSYFSGGEYYGGLGYSGDFKETGKKLQKEVRENGELLGVYAYDSNFVRIYKDRAVFSWEDDVARYRELTLTAEEFGRLKDYLAANKVDELAPFLACYGECETKELLMLGRNGGRRIFGKFSKPPEFFAGLDKFFADMKQEPARIKYTLSKELPGLEILFADDDLQAETVWKNSDDLRLLVSSRSAKEKVENDIADMQEAAEESDDEAEDSEQNIADIREKREYESYAWHKFSNALGEVTSQPAGVEFIPIKDSLSVQRGAEQWKARGPDFEIRTDSEGLYRVSRGRLTKILSGNYESPLVSANGRWAVAKKYTEEYESLLVRINLLTGKEFAVPFEDYPMAAPTAFIPAQNKFLITGSYYGEDYEGYDGEEGMRRQTFFLLDAATGLITPAAGEMRPVAQQTFRSLQPSVKVNEFWAAIPNARKNETNVGMYDARLMKFTAVLRIPKISFNSMNMWIDEAARKIYFVYNGHLLAVPLPK